MVYNFFKNRSRIRANRASDSLMQRCNAVFLVLMLVSGRVHDFTPGRGVDSWLDRIIGRFCDSVKCLEVAPRFNTL
jgi:hypothetical protein